MNVRSGFGLAAGALLILSSAAHAFLGWPPLRASLEAGNLDARLVGALGIGWHFGSVAMLVFGLIVLHAALKTMRRGEVDAGPARVIAIAYVVFGLVAWVSRDFNPHFLLFVVTGLLVGVFAFWREETSCP